MQSAPNIILIISNFIHAIRNSNARRASFFEFHRVCCSASVLCQYFKIIDFLLLFRRKKLDNNFQYKSIQHDHMKEQQPFFCSPFLFEDQLELNEKQQQRALKVHITAARDFIMMNHALYISWRQKYDCSSVRLKAQISVSRIVLIFY